MNSVNLIGRLTRDPEVRYTTDGKAVARFSIAIDRFSKGGEKRTDFPNIVCFDRTAENVDRFLHKGSQVGISGSIQTGSYDKNIGGQVTKVYTTEVLAARVDFFGGKEETKESFAPEQMGFKSADEDIPF